MNGFFVIDPSFSIAPSIFSIWDSDEKEYELNMQESPLDITGHDEEGTAIKDASKVSKIAKSCCSTASQLSKRELLLIV